MESRYATFLVRISYENTPTTYSHESFISKMAKLLIHANFGTHVKNLEDDGTMVTYKSKR
jgi:hypothetical protein